MWHWLHILSLSAIITVSVCRASAQTNTVASKQDANHATLSMDWSRGDAYYGPDFITLMSPCQGGAECKCVLEFKATRSKEFADYVASLPHGKVPVVFDVLRSPNGSVSAARLSNVGDWTGDRFRSPNDGLLSVRRSASPPQQSGKVNNPGDCFPAFKP